MVMEAIPEGGVSWRIIPSACAATMEINQLQDFGSKWGIGTYRHLSCISLKNNASMHAAHA
jgi:hypothetical protein